MKTQSILLFLLTLLVITSCYNDSDFNSENFNSNNLIVAIEPTNIPDLLANNSDRLKIRVLLVKESEVSTPVRFELSDGSFVANSGKSITVLSAREIDENGGSVNVAETEIKTGFELGMATLIINVANYETSLPININRSFPSEAILGAESLVLSPSFGAELNLEGRLNALSGFVTLGHSLSIRAESPQTGLEVGTFRVADPRTDSLGRADFIYTIAPDTAFRGNLNFILSTIGQNNQQIKDTLTVFAVKN